MGVLMTSDEIECLQACRYPRSLVSASIEAYTHREWINGKPNLGGSVWSSPRSEYVLIFAFLAH
ncbi:hypothetical protein ACTXT7_009631 [Hymenolepis weldensis]